MHQIELLPNKKIYFASDFHFGVAGIQSSQERELQVCQWLDSIKADAQHVFLVGDLFDFWFEYKTVVPKGFLRFFAKIIELQQHGIAFSFFTGNHDLWMRDYFEKELGIAVYHEPRQFDIAGAKFYVGHGDGLGPGDANYKILKKVFTNPLAQFLFGWLHPDLGMRLATGWSQSRKTEQRLVTAAAFQGNEKEWLYSYCIDIEAQTHHDFYIFGHRHLALDLALGAQARYINLGEWFISGTKTYAVFDGSRLTLQAF